MTWIPVKTPKPPVRAKRTRAPLRNRKPLKRTRLKCGAGSKRRGRSSFPKQRDKKYTKWLVTENECLLAARFTRGAITLHDTPMESGWYLHQCWGPIDPAHVGDTQARGAPDFGVLVPLCRAAHRFYDNKRFDWRKTTGFTEKAMASAASGYALKYCEQGGSSTPHT